MGRYVLLNMMLVDKLIQVALSEDVGTGDITTLSTVPSNTVAKGFIYAKEAGIVAGLPIAKRVFEMLDNSIEFISHKSDGEQIFVKDVLATVSGSAQSILTGERVALNLLQRMSGIATRTSKITEILKGYNTTVVDTRKTLPGLRIIDKYSVRMGGGRNHRFGLYDGILIKDNHIKVAGGITKAVNSARNNAPHTIKIEVEVENLGGVAEALSAGVDIIMLDNMDYATVQKAVQLINGQAMIEISGGINEENIQEFAKAGVDLISIGALTHSVKALDISLDVGEIK